MKSARSALLTLVWFALSVGTVLKPAQAQVALYGEFSATDLHNLVSTDILYGGTAGVLYDGPTLFHHVTVSADIQGRFVRKSSPPGYLGPEMLNGITIGPRFSVPLGHGIAPFGEFMVGFARYNNGQVGGSTTDSTLQANVGATKMLTPRLDAVADYSYAQYYGLGGEYNPKTFSAGVIFHFVKR